jgi:hypothetical protein
MNENDLQNNLPINVPSNIPKKKNRTLQYYKFLLYAMKMEIKIHEFIDLVRFSNQSELALWVLSVVLFFNSPTGFRNIIVWFQIIHVIRGLIGVVLTKKLPRSYNLVDAMDVESTSLDNRLFNDIVRDVVKREVIDKLKEAKCLMIMYFVLTFFNFIFDVVELFHCMGYLNENFDLQGQIVLLTFIIIAFLFLSKYLEI